jgi:ABC-type branched-subunit amino acid transport system permease subunit
MTPVLRRRLEPTVFLVVAIVVLSVVIRDDQYWLDASVMLAIFSMFALSAGMSYGQAGIPSIATGAFGAVGAYSSAILTMRLGMSPALTLVVAALVPAVIAYPLAKSVTRLSPLPLSLATFAFSGAFEIGIRGGGQLTGGFVGISGIPPLAVAPTPQAMHVLAWAIVAVTVFVCTNLIRSPYGRAINTARHDPLRATADGVNVSQLLAGFFSFSASIASVGGWLYAHYVSYLSPESLNTATAISALLMAVVGGAQTILGPIIGATVLTLVNNFLPATQAQGMVYGAALVIVLILAPQGLTGLGRLPWLQRRGARRTLRPISQP